MNNKKLAEMMAKKEVMAWLLMDKNEYSGFTQNFAEIYSILFRTDSENALRLGKLFAKVMQLHDFVEDKTSKNKRFRHKNWKAVEKIMVLFCKVAGINKKFGFEYSNFLRYHTAEKKQWAGYLENAQVALLHSITQDINFAKTIAPLYAIGVRAHDEHSKEMWYLGERVAFLYYFMLLNRLDK